MLLILRVHASDIKEAYVSLLPINHNQLKNLYHCFAYTDDKIDYCDDKQQSTLFNKIGQYFSKNKSFMI